MMLTAEIVEAGLYCTSPTGYGQLATHLQQRGFEVDGDALARMITALGAKISTCIITIGDTPVTLLVLRGTRVG